MRPFQSTATETEASSSSIPARRSARTFNLGFSLCDLSNKYKQAIYGVEDDELEGWMPTEHSPYFAFETKYTKASKRLMTAKTSLTLATAGCALDGKAFEASSFVDALEAVEAQC